MKAYSYRGGRQRKHGWQSITIEGVPLVPFLAATAVGMLLLSCIIYALWRVPLPSQLTVKPPMP